MSVLMCPSPIPARSQERPNLLSLPPELRNQIYQLLFAPPMPYTPSVIDLQTCASSGLTNFGRSNTRYNRTRPRSDSAALTRSCRQIRNEAQFMFLNTTPFHVTGLVADPSMFIRLTSHLSVEQRKAIRHITLTAKIAHLRSLNEAWDSIPFGHEDLFLETLTVVPQRPSISGSAFAEVADLSQCHTLAYILSETLKGLRNVATVVVRNEDCFNDVIWRLVYRSMIFRLWKWCGRLCDLRFRDHDDGRYFEVRCGVWQTQTAADKDEGGWSDVLQELRRLVGADSDIRNAPDGL